MFIKWLLLASAVCASISAASVVGICCYKESVNRRLLAVVGFCISVLGIYLLIANLGNPSRALNLLANLTAPISLMAVSQALVAIMLLLFMITARRGIAMPLAVLGILCSLFYAIAGGRFYMFFTRPALNHIITVLLIAAFICALAAHMNLSKSGKQQLIAFIVTAIFTALFMVFVIRLGFLEKADKVLTIPQLTTGGLAMIFWLVALDFAAAFATSFLALKRPGKLVQVLPLIFCLLAGSGVLCLFNITKSIGKTMY